MVGADGIALALESISYKAIEKQIVHFNMLITQSQICKQGTIQMELN